jgi:hypothetical protein
MGKWDEQGIRNILCYFSIKSLISQNRHSEIEYLIPQACSGSAISTRNVTVPFFLSRYKSSTVL